MRCWVISMPTDYNHNKTNHKWGVKIAFLHKSGGFLGHNFYFQLGALSAPWFLSLAPWHSVSVVHPTMITRILAGRTGEKKMVLLSPFSRASYSYSWTGRRHCYLVRGWEVHISKIQCFGDKGGRGFCYFGSRILKCTTFHLFIWIEPLISQGQPTTS